MPAVVVTITRIAFALEFVAALLVCGAFESDNRATLDEDFKLFIQAELGRT